MSIRAKAIVTDGNGHFGLEPVELEAPQAGEVLIEIKASGVCHTDLDSMFWKRRMIMGHEGAGVVQLCGAGVTNVSPGDVVVLNWAIPCGTCFQCRIGAENICEQRPTIPETRIRCGNAPLGSSFGLGTMATHAIVPWQAVVKIGGDIPFPSAAIMGCGVMTGFGSVINAARVTAGSSVVIIGTGGVGLSVIQGAAYCDAATIVAVDLNTYRLELARDFGATHTIRATVDDRDLREVAEVVRQLTLRGADYAFECTAVPELSSSPLRMIRNGGMAVAVSGVEQVVPVDMQLFEWDKVYINPLYGQSRPFTDLPLLASLYRDKKLKLDEMVSHTYPLSGLGEAFDHMKKGLNAKGVLIPGA